MKSPSANAPMLEWALAYARLGWKVFPLRTKGDLKAPHALVSPDKGPAGHKLASSDPRKIKAWWQKEPKAGIGLSLSASGLIALDADLYHPGVRQTLDRLIKIHGPFSSPVQADTGGGGVHTLFSAPEGIRPPGKLAGEAGLDLKYNGYIVLAPSPHSKQAESGVFEPTGKFYRWQPGRDPFENIELLPLVPSWFLSRDGKQVAVVGQQDADDVFAEDTPKAGLSLEQTQVLLDAVKNDGSEDVDYETWLAILSGIYHEFDGSAEAKALAEEWSERNPKHDPEKFEKSWKSLDISGKGRAPTTLRFLIKIGTERLKQAAAQAAINFRSEIADCFTRQELRELCDAIKSVEMDLADRENLAACVQAQWKALTGMTLKLADAKRMIRFEDPALAVRPTWVEGYVFLTNENVFIKAGQENGISKAAFDSAYNRYMLTPRERAEGETLPYNKASDAALNRWMIDTADKRMYMPDAEQFFKFGPATCFNTFSADEQPAIPERLTQSDFATVRIVQDHLKHLIPDARTRGIFTSWLAYIVQTHKRPNWTIILQSPEGEGKSFFAELMGAVLGASNVSVLDTAVLTGRFTGWAHGHLLKIVEEIKLHGADRYKILDILKPYITNPTITIEAKRENNKTVRNTAAYLMFTNYRDSIPITEGDTRYFMIASPRQTAEASAAWKKQVGPDYFANLFQAIDAAPGALRKWFLQYKLHPEFSPTSRAPWSEEKEYVIRLNVGQTEDAMNDILHEGQPGLNGVLCDATLLHEKLLSDAGLAVTPQAVASLLTKQGYTLLARAKVEGRKRRYWSQQPKLFISRFESQTNVKIREYLEKAATEGL